MCLALVALDAVPGWPLILLANRDERHGRPAEPLDWWSDRPDIVGGRDARAGGSWLALRRDARFAAVLNDARVRPPSDAPSRGMMVTECLENADAHAIAAELHARRSHYAGFHLLLGEPGGGWYLGSHVDHPRPLSAGIHTVGNAGLDPGDARLRRIRGLFEATLASGVSVEALLCCLADTTEIGSGTGDCRPVFIADSEFGTRCSTVFTLAADGRACVHERRFRAGGHKSGDSTRQWRVASVRGCR